MMVRLFSGTGTRITNQRVLARLGFKAIAVRPMVRGLVLEFGREGGDGIIARRAGLDIWARDFSNSAPLLEARCCEGENDNVW